MSPWRSKDPMISADVKILKFSHELFFFEKGTGALF
jgi:hypothetical protein